ncbi:ATP-binding cassette domain-containing protein [Granulosicoccaceae sp. 1_MG-2023]|nr:ATP-binding cassette domain-containing protein [Granulosicoccaceae sp. 1_MG-2023]
MLTVENLHCVAGNTTLSVPSFSVSPNSCHVITGPTGCGKTLFLEALLGLNPARGLIRLDQQEISAEPAERRGFGYVPQDLALFPHLTVSENIYYAIKCGHGSQDEARAHIARLCRTTRIEHLLDRYPARLSGGEKQRVALVRALAGGARVVLLDEPFSALNQSLRQEIWELLKSLQAEYQLHILLVTHDLDEAMYLGDMISVMQDGRLIQSGPKQLVYERPANISVARLFGIRNLFRARLRRIDARESVLYDTPFGQDLYVWSEHLPDTVGDRDEIYFGIRSTEVMLLRRDTPLPERRNLIDGRIGGILHSGSFSNVHFRPHNSDCELEISLNTHAFRKLNLGPAQERSVSLKEESLFVFTTQTP